MKHHREIAFLFLRLTVAVIFLFYGFNKFKMGIGDFAAGFQERFAEQLPLFLLTVFAWVLPFAEVILGVLLLAGLFTVYALAGAAALMVVLTFGAVIEPNPPTVANNALLALIVFVLLFLLNHNRCSLDEMRAERSRPPPSNAARFNRRPGRRRRRKGGPPAGGGPFPSD